MVRKSSFSDHLVIPSLVFCLLLSCHSNKNEIPDMKAFDTIPGTFGYDLAFLSQYMETVVLSDSLGKAQLAIIPGWQARVMTSTANGAGGFSYGWINHELISSQDTLEHMNPFGGEERIWLGPEGGPFSLYFKKGFSQVFENWFVPPELDLEGFEHLSSSPDSASFSGQFTLVNYHGTEMEIGLKRTISLLNRQEINHAIGTVLPDQVSAVAYQSENVLTNMGKQAWTTETGMPCIWLLGMFNPSPGVTMFIPFREGEVVSLGPPVVDDYFGKVPADRLKVDEGMIYFRADGKYRSKIGIPSRRALPFSGSYDAQNRILTLLWCDLPEGDPLYVNGKWGDQVNPYSGDAINAYNDGPVEDGNQMGPFYELESSSPAAHLAPNERLIHRQRTFHFEGEDEALSRITEKIFGIGLEDIKTKF
jgi:hypothetical protein